MNIYTKDKTRAKLYGWEMGNGKWTQSNELLTQAN